MTETPTAAAWRRVAVGADAALRVPGLSPVALVELGETRRRASWRLAAERLGPMPDRPGAVTAARREAWWDVRAGPGEHTV